MTTTTLRSNLHKAIDKIEDKDFLQAILIIANAKLTGIKSTLKEYTLPGEPMTVEEYRERIISSRKGKAMDHDDFLKEIEKW